MSFFDRYVNSKFYHYTDIFFKIVVLNLLMLLTAFLGLIIFGLPVALSSGTLTLRAILNKTSLGVFETYKDILKKTYKKVVPVGLLFEGIIGLLLFNTTFFYLGLEPFSWYYLVGFSIMGSLFLFSFIVFYHAIILSVIYELNIQSLIKHSVLLTAGFMVRSLIALVLVFIYGYTMVLIPLLGLIMGLSGLVLILLSILLKGYEKIESLENDLNEKLEDLIA